ncbi:MAG TPA: CHAP domain-containing protein [Candidatus Saccharimonadales bacterium]
MHIQKQFTSRILSRTTVVAIVAVIAITGVAVPIVQADQYDDQIRALRDQNAQAGSAVNDLQSQANSYQDAINQLQVQINGIQAQIATNQAEQARLVADIADKQIQLDAQRAVLAADIKSMYVDGQMSPIEMLATSKNLSDYVDKEEYRNRAQTAIQDTMTKITKLQSTLKGQKEQVEQLLATQKAQEAQIAADQAQQSQMLAYTEAQKNAFNQQIAANSSKISDLKKQQAIENARKFGSSAGMVGGGGYPWGNAPCLHTGQVTGYCSDYDWAVNGSIWNPSTGGYGYRNCTDWVAWRAGAPGGLGHANTWAVRSEGVRYVGTTPHAGDAAVDETGKYGHVMYIEAADANSITVSDYNRLGDGLYRMSTLTRVGDGAYRSSTGVTSYLRFVSF